MGSARSRVLTVPNLISLARLLCVPVFLWMLWEPHPARRGAAILLAVGADCLGSGKQRGAAGGDDIVLIDAIAADPDRADQHAVAKEGKPARENGYAVGKVRIHVG